MCDLNHERRIDMLERMVKGLDRMYLVLLFAVFVELGAIVTLWE